jgi:hypothetical protein
MHGGTGGHMGGGHVPPPMHQPESGHFDQAVHSDHAYIAGQATAPGRNKVAARSPRQQRLAVAILVGFLVALVLLIFLA